jgi:predicted MFS family arabinose efflux permease
MSVVAAVGAAVISRRALIRGPLTISAVAIMAGGVAMMFVTSTTNIVLLIALSLLFGVALGFTGTSNQAALYTQTTAEQIGVASGLARTASYLGAIFASALIALAYPGRATDAGLHVSALVVLIAGVAVLALVLLDRRLPWRGH